MIKVKHRGNFRHTEKFFTVAPKIVDSSRLGYYGQMGVDALASATPKQSGITAASWSYEISQTKGGCSLSWHNSNVNDGVNIAVIIQYGHGTGTGGYVSGIDYINPALRPVFEKIADDIWKEVTSL